MRFNVARVPNLITPCPIGEAVFEERFDSDAPAEVIMALLFNSLKDDFPKIEKLPILELPQVIREGDPNLKYSAYYSLKGSEFSLQIGPKCIGVSAINDYVGWKKYSKKIEDVLKILDQVKVVKKPVRIGLRYINFFENTDIFSKLKVQVTLDGNTLVGKENTMRTEFDYDGFRCVVQLASLASFNEKEGSVFDMHDVPEQFEKVFRENFWELLA